MDGGGKDFLSLLTTSETLPHPLSMHLSNIFDKVYICVVYNGSKVNLERWQ